MLNKPGLVQIDRTRLVHRFVGPIGWSSIILITMVLPHQLCEEEDPVTLAKYVKKKRSTEACNCTLHRRVRESRVLLAVSSFSFTE